MSIKQYGSIEEALEDVRSENRDSSLPFLYSRSYERVYLGPNNAYRGKIAVEEAYDIRFFGESSEIRIFWEEGERKAIKIAEGDDQRFIDVEVPLSKSFIKKKSNMNRPHDFQKNEKGPSITKRMILEYDEDGQAQVSYTRLLGLNVDYE